MAGIPAGAVPGAVPADGKLTSPFHFTRMHAPADAPRLATSLRDACLLWCAKPIIGHMPADEEPAAKAARTDAPPMPPPVLPAPGPPALVPPRHLAPAALAPPPLAFVPPPFPMCTPSSLQGTTCMWHLQGITQFAKLAVNLRPGTPGMPADIIACSAWSGFRETSYVLSGRRIALRIWDADRREVGMRGWGARRPLFMHALGMHAKRTGPLLRQHTKNACSSTCAGTQGCLHPSRTCRPRGWPHHQCWPRLRGCRAWAMPARQLARHLACPSGPSW